MGAPPAPLAAHPTRARTCQHLPKLPVSTVVQRTGGHSSPTHMEEGALPAPPPPPPPQLCAPTSKRTRACESHDTSLLFHFPVLWPIPVLTCALPDHHLHLPPAWQGLPCQRARTAQGAVLPVTLTLVSWTPGPPEVLCQHPCRHAEPFGRRLCCTGLSGMQFPPVD